MSDHKMLWKYMLMKLYTMKLTKRIYRRHISYLVSVEFNKDYHAGYRFLHYLDYVLIQKFYTADNS